MFKHRFLIIFVLLGLSLNQISAQQIDLKKLNWKLENLNSDISVENANPSDVHLTLLKEGIIPDSFYRLNEKEVQWVGQEDWIYTCKFFIDSSLIQNQTATIVFEGLDTYAYVFLNDSLILRTDNMFVKWETEINSILKLGDNSLRLVFKNPIEINEQKAKKLNYKLPDDRGFTRKAAYQFGWDWGPKIVTMGIWKDARIKFEKDISIEDLFIEQKYVKEDKAEIEIKVKVKVETEVENGLSLKVEIEGLKSLRKEINLVNGKNSFSFPIEIKKPKLWWPNGLGAQNLYEIKVSILDGEKVLDEKHIKTGLRSGEVVQEKDSIGKSFYFRVNGQNVFAKGANYIPNDNFLARVTKEDYEKLLNTAVKSNFNMLRVWGGGIYENDEFYELCDEKGIMLWQDFMFAGNMYPDDSGFLKSIELEATQNVKRLRNHPSIVLWCGNNEISEAWHNWGWQKTYGWSEQDSTELWNNYLNIFEKMLPDIVQKYSPGTFYWPSSPSNGWGTEKGYKEGDVHYWGVWWGKEPFEKYEEKIGRFNSEYGFQGMPDLKSIKSFAIPSDLDINSEVMKLHQKHPFGWENILEYLERDYPNPENFKQLIYLSQLMQAEGIKTAIEAHRRAKPFCMGTLYWQLNDCWPVTSWSSVDYYGRWKALQYFVKKAYDKYLVSFEENENGLDVFFVSDDTSAFEAVVNWKLIDFNGENIFDGEHEISIDKNSSTVIKIFNGSELQKWEPLDNKILIVEVFNSKEKLASAVKIFTKAKNLKLHTDKPEFEVSKTKDGYLLSFKSATLIKGLQISCSKDGFFSDNYFDLLPGKSKIVFFETKSNSIVKNDFAFLYLKKE